MDTRSVCTKTLSIHSLNHLKKKVFSVCVCAFSKGGGECRGGDHHTIAIVNVSKNVIVIVLKNVIVNVFVFVKIVLSNIQICATCAAHDKVPKCKSDT